MCGGQAPTAAHVAVQAGPTGALLVGSPAEVAAKIKCHAEALGGISRVTLQLDVAALPHEQVRQATELLGTEVAPLLRQAGQPAGNGI